MDLNTYEPQIRWGVLLRMYISETFPIVVGFYKLAFRMYVQTL